MIQNRAQMRLTEFHRAQDGAVTVDWIVLTAALVMMGIGAAFYIASSVPKVAENVKNYMEGVEVGG